MEASEDGHYEAKYKSERFLYVMIAILFMKIETERKSVLKSGVGFEASALKRKLMYLGLVVVQRNIFDQFTNEE